MVGSYLVLSGTFCVRSATCVRSAMPSALCSLVIFVSGRVLVSLVPSVSVGVCIVNIRDVSCHEAIAYKQGMEGSDYVDVVLLLSANGRERVQGL